MGVPDRIRRENRGHRSPAGRRLLTGMSCYSECSETRAPASTYLSGEVNLSFGQEPWCQMPFFLRFNQGLRRMTFRHFDGSSRVWLAFALIVVTAVIDWRVDAPIAFGFLYLFPVLLVGSVRPRWQVLITALLCTLLADLFDPYRFSAAIAAAAGHPGLHLAGGHGIVRVRNHAQPAAGTGEPPPRGKRSRRASRSRRAARVSDR